MRCFMHYPCYGLITFIFVVACDIKPSIKFDIAVYDNEKNPLDRAEILIDENKIGESDANGAFTAELGFFVGSTIELKVKKESSKAYYATYQERLNSADLHKKTIEVILYSVPKIDLSKEDFPNIEEPAKLEKEPETSKPNASNSASREKDLPKEVSQIPLIESSLSLTPMTNAPEATPLPPALIEIAKPEPKSVYTLNIRDQEKKRPLGAVEAYIGKGGDENLSLACKSNARGRCVIYFKEEQSITLILKKPNYVTLTQEIRLKKSGQRTISLAKGLSIDIFALSRSYERTTGVRDLDIFVDEQHVGKTDAFGHLSYHYTGRKEDLVSVKIKAKNHLPEEYITDFVVADKITLRKYFSPTHEPRMRATLFPSHFSGDMPSAIKDEGEFYSLYKSLSQEMEKAVRKEIFSSPRFIEVKREILNQNLLKHIDASIHPNLISYNDSILFELEVRNQKGKILGAAITAIRSPINPDSIFQAAKVVITKLLRVIPSQATVLSANPEQVQISSGANIEEFDQVEFFGLNLEKFGEDRQLSSVGIGEVQTVNENSASVKLKKQQSLSLLSRGDIAMLRKHPEYNLREGARIVLKITDARLNQPLKHANVYAKDIWIGQTDASGKFSLLQDDISDIAVIKPGYIVYRNQDDRSNFSKTDIALTPRYAFLQVSSEPFASQIKADGWPLGSTPLSIPLVIKTSSVLLEIPGPAGYSSKIQTLDFRSLDNDLTFEIKAKLERDYFKSVENLLASGNTAAAVRTLQQIPKDHGSYADAQKHLGMIYLDRLKNPFKSLEHLDLYQALVKNQAASERALVDLNIAKACYEAANWEAKEGVKTKAISFYKRSAKILEGIEPHLSNLSEEKFHLNYKNASYLKALTYEELRKIDPDPSITLKAKNSWTEYANRFEDNGNEPVGPATAHAAPKMRQLLAPAKM